MHFNNLRVLAIDDLLYGIPILAQNRGPIGQTNFRNIEASGINYLYFFYPLKCSFRSFKIAEIAICYPNIDKNRSLIGENNETPIVVSVITVKPFRIISSSSLPFKIFSKCSQNG